MTYKPQPIDTANINLSKEILELAECLAENVHDLWAKQRMAEGWTFGSERNDSGKRHPDLVPYQNLPESEKAYDRMTVIETLKAIFSLGYRIEKG